MAFHRIPVLLGVVATLACTPTLEAQVILQTWTAPFINSLSCVDDVDGDGAKDIALAHTTLDVYSGRTGLLLRQITPQPPYGYVGAIIDVGDVDGDSRADLMLMLGDLAYTMLDLQVVSGATGATIHTFPGPWGASGIGDLNGDSKNEFLLGYGASIGGMSNVGRIDLIDGATGTVLRSQYGTVPNQNLYRVQRVGDFDGDGYDDYFTRDDFGTLRIHSGLTGAQLLSGQYPSYYHRYFGLGDFNADGFDDFGFSDNWPFVTATNTYIIGGPSGAQLWHHLWVWNNPGPVNFSGALPAGDVDSDGYSDVFSSGGSLQNMGAGQWCVMSGRDQSILLDTNYYANNQGNPIESVGDTNGDGVPDFLTRDSYTIHIVSGIPPGVAAIGSGCPDATGRVPKIGIGRGARLGQTMTVNLSNANPALIAAVLALGFSDQAWNGTPLPHGLAAYGLPACSLYVSPDIALWLPTAGLNGTRHHAQYPLPVPQVNALLGLDLFAQWLVFEQPSPGILAGATTRAMRMRVVP